MPKSWRFCNSKPAGRDLDSDCARAWPGQSFVFAWKSKCAGASVAGLTHLQKKKSTIKAAFRRFELRKSGHQGGTTKRVVDSPAAQRQAA